MRLDCVSDADAECVLIKAAQCSSFPDLVSNPTIHDHKFVALRPFLDDNGIVRVGGRLKQSDLHFGAKHPILLPAKNSISCLIIRHYHKLVNHQGRHLTLGAVREAGYHIEHATKVIRQIIKSCVFCNKLRTPTAQQLMADLPMSRVEETPPFCHSGVDVFGPYSITDGKCTRQNYGSRKFG